MNYGQGWVGSMLGQQQPQAPSMTNFGDPNMARVATKKRNSAIVPTEYVASDKKEGQLDNVAEPSSMGGGYSGRSIEQAFGLGNDVSTKQQVLSGVLGFAKPLLAGLGELSDPDQGNFGGAAVRQGLRDLDTWGTQDQTARLKQQQIRYGLMKDDDLNRAYAMTEAQFGQPGSPAIPYDALLAQNVSRLQQFSKMPSDFNPYLLNNYDEQSGDYNVDQAIRSWERNKIQRAYAGRSAGNSPQFSLEIVPVKGADGVVRQQPKVSATKLGSMDQIKNIVSDMEQNPNQYPQADQSGSGVKISKQFKNKSTGQTVTLTGYSAEDIQQQLAQNPDLIPAEEPGFWEPLLNWGGSD